MFDCILSRGYDTASNFGFGIPDSESLECAIKAILRDDPHPGGGALSQPEMSDACLKIHVVSGKLDVYTRSPNK